jgi:hypothetical protein
VNRPFHPNELTGTDGYEPTPAELAEALATARSVESHLSASDVHPSVGFVDRVMTAIVEEPRPQPATAAGQAMRRGRIRAMVAALADSWRVAFSGGRPLAVRAQAAAFVLVVILAFGSIGGLAAAGAVRLLQPGPTNPVPPQPTLHQPSALPTPSDRAPVVSTPTPTPAPTPTAEPTETSDPGDSAEPTETDEPGNTPGATKRETPAPRETPEPTESEHPGGGGGGGGGSPDN